MGNAILTTLTSSSHSPHSHPSIPSNKHENQNNNFLDQQIAEIRQNIKEKNSILFDLNYVFIIFSPPEYPTNKIAKYLSKIISLPLIEPNEYIVNYNQNNSYSKNQKNSQTNSQNSPYKNSHNSLNSLQNNSQSNSQKDSKKDLQTNSQKNSQHNSQNSSPNTSQKASQINLEKDSQQRISHTNTQNNLQTNTQNNLNIKLQNEFDNEFDNDFEKNEKYSLQDFDEDEHHNEIQQQNKIIELNNDTENLHKASLTVDAVDNDFINVSTKTLLRKVSTINEETTRDRLINRIKRSDCQKGFILYEYPETITEMNILKTEIVPEMRVELIFLKLDQAVRDFFNLIYFNFNDITSYFNNL